MSSATSNVHTVYTALQDPSTVESVVTYLEAVPGLVLLRAAYSDQQGGVHILRRKRRSRPPLQAEVKRIRLRGPVVETVGRSVAAAAHASVVAPVDVDEIGVNALSTEPASAI
jgi:hypothetical protein